MSHTQLRAQATVHLGHSILSQAASFPLQPVPTLCGVSSTRPSWLPKPLDPSLTQIPQGSVWVQPQPDPLRPQLPQHCPPHNACPHGPDGFWVQQRRGAPLPQEPWALSPGDKAVRLPPQHRTPAAAGPSSAGGFSLAVVTLPCDVPWRRPALCPQASSPSSPLLWSCRSVTTPSSPLSFLLSGGPLYFKATPAGPASGPSPS